MISVPEKRVLEANIVLLGHEIRLIEWQIQMTNGVGPSQLLELTSKAAEKDAVFDLKLTISATEIGR